LGPDPWQPDTWQPDTWQPDTGARTRHDPRRRAEVVGQRVPAFGVFLGTLPGHLEPCLDTITARRAMMQP
jgi:hypothetical protein